MCEFKVILDDKKVFEDAIYAREHGDHLLLRNVLGQTKELKGCQIVEVDVEKEELKIIRKPA